MQCRSYATACFRESTTRATSLIAEIRSLCAGKTDKRARDPRRTDALRPSSCHPAKSFQTV
jgi:hypothetical protein